MCIYYTLWAKPQKLFPLKISSMAITQSGYTQYCPRVISRALYLGGLNHNKDIIYNGVFPAPDV
jgi:hypothetical protein